MMKKPLMTFLKEASLYELAKAEMLIVDDIPCFKLQMAWDSLSEESTKESEIIKSEGLLLIKETYKNIGPNKASKDVMVMCDVPFRCSVNNRSYTTRSCSKEAQKLLFQIVFEPEFDFDIFIIATKSYYGNEAMYRKTFTNYILDGTYQAIYDEYVEKGVNSISRSGGRSRYTV